MRPRLVAAVVPVALLALAGCGSDDGTDADPANPSDPAGQSTTSTAVVEPPGDQYTSSWEPTVPDQPVDPDVVTDYEPVLDAVVAAAGDGLTWADSELSTETFDDLCVIKLERTATGSSPLGFDDLQQALGAAVTGLGFADLAPENDPGGAIKLVAHDDAEALLEYRSKNGTTVAVRVATTDTQCG